MDTYGPAGGHLNGTLVLDLEGFEGPIDLLLALARDQKVDILRISIVSLADQYLDFLRAARSLRMEVAADYLVMAAWLAYLKSRLLLPPDGEGDGEPSAEELAEALAYKLARLEAVRDAAARLTARPQLGEAVHKRGSPEGLRIVTRPVWSASLYDLLKAYGAIERRGGSAPFTPPPLDLYPHEAALDRLERFLGQPLEWRTLYSFLPEDLDGGVGSRSAIAATFTATLELAKSGRLRLRQDTGFGPIFVRGLG